jgi:hypothetical protein
MFDLTRFFAIIAVVGVVTGGILMAVNNTYQHLHAGITTDEIITKRKECEQSIPRNMICKPVITFVIAPSK